MGNKEILKPKKENVMRLIYCIIALFMILWVAACEGGSSGTLTGRVVDGFGNPLGGDAVMITLTDNPAVTHPDRYGNFIIHAPSGSYTLQITFINPDAGFNYKLSESINISQGTRNLGEFTLLNAQNMQAWEAYRDADYQAAISKFNEQASQARTGQLVFLPYMRYQEGEPNQNTLLTQGVLSAENGLGWAYARGLHDIPEATIHWQASLSGGYNNIDAKVGLAGLALSNGQAQAAKDYLDAIIAEPGDYDTTQIHDNIRETDLIASRSLAEFLLGFDKDSGETAASIIPDLEAGGNSGSRELLNMLTIFRPNGNSAQNAQ
jgi:hypothetical protein